MPITGRCEVVRAWSCRDWTDLIGNIINNTCICSPSPPNLDHVGSFTHQSPGPFWIDGQSHCSDSQSHWLHSSNRRWHLDSYTLGYLRRWHLHYKLALNKWGDKSEQWREHHKLKERLWTSEKNKEGDQKPQQKIHYLRNLIHQWIWHWEAIPSMSRKGIKERRITTGREIRSSVRV